MDIVAYRSIVEPLKQYEKYGFSDDAKLIQEVLKNLTELFTSTESYGDRIPKIIEHLSHLENCYANENWDGYGAEQISDDSLSTALKFTLSMPIDVPLPEMDVIPTGQIVLTWSKGKRQLFSIIMGDKNELSYAGLFGVSREYGVTYFDNSIPDDILSSIRKACL